MLSPQKPAAVFFPISGLLIGEPQMYDTNNKRSFDMSEYEKLRCLTF